MDAPMVAHFIEKNHAPEEMEFCVLVKREPKPYISLDISKELLLNEAYHIHKLQPLNPTGLNAELYISPLFNGMKHLEESLHGKPSCLKFVANLSFKKLLMSV